MGKTRINTAADDLRLELQDAALSLRCAYDRFNHVTDPELVEASIYETNSLHIFLHGIQAKSLYFLMEEPHERFKRSLQPRKSAEESKIGRAHV